MAPKPNSDAANYNGSNGKTAASNTATQTPYAPSVPIPVYRELAAELQATKAMLESLNAQNQALTRQNALLKQEVQTIVQSALNLQQVIAPQNSVQRFDPPPAEVMPPAIAPNFAPKVSYESPEPRLSDRPAPAPDQAPSAKVSKKGKAPDVTPVPSPASLNLADLPTIDQAETFFTEHPESPHALEKEPRQLSGLWLLLIVLTIMVTAFTAGFLVMRPILLKNSQ